MTATPFRASAGSDRPCFHRYLRMSLDLTRPSSRPLLQPVVYRSPQDPVMTVPGSRIVWHIS